MKHHTRLAIIVLLSACLYISMHHPVRAVVEVDQSLNQPANKPSVLTKTLGIKSGEVDPQSNGEWQVLLNESFEGAWPSSGWSVVDLSNDGYDRKWGSDDYRPHPPSLKAAWPARSGTNGRDPTSKKNDYFNTMDTRMAYGPFDLSNASTLEISFWMWWQTEANRDYAILEVSRDNITFDELGRWNGTSSGWQPIFVSTDDYALDSSVWVAWRFTSNTSNVFDGPWVDDILLRKYKVGLVTAHGTLSYYNRQGIQVPAPYTTVHLYDYDFDLNHDLLAITSTNVDGSFQFPHISNWDNDDPSDPDHHLDLWVFWEAVYDDSMIANHTVVYFDNQTYKWYSDIRTNVQDGTDAEFNYYIPSGYPILDAMWIFQDLRRSWEYTYDNTSPSYDPGDVRVKWENNENSLAPCSGSCFYGFGPYVFIADQNTLSSDTVVHEVGHNYMYNATNGWWLWWDIDCYEHYIFSQEDQACAWSEGWADFFPLAVNDDPCYDFDVGPCTGDPDIQHFNLELHSREDLGPFPWGDIVEGRIAGSLYDLFDFNWPYEGYDSAYFGFNPIISVILNNEIVEENFYSFWDSWKIEHNKHHTVRAFFQNTIDYDTAPAFNPSLPLLYALENNPIHHILDLWSYSIDGESQDSELTYSVSNNYGCDFSVTDGHWIDVAPWLDWLGYCYATIEISDSIMTNDGTLWVYVKPVVGIAYLPIVIK